MISRKSGYEREVQGLHMCTDVNDVDVQIYLGTSKNYQNANGVKLGKIDLKWQKPSMFRLFSCEMPRNCCF